MIERLGTYHHVIPFSMDGEGHFDFTFLENKTAIEAVLHLAVSTAYLTFIQGVTYGTSPYDLPSRIIADRVRYLKECLHRSQMLEGSYMEASELIAKPYDFRGQTVSAVARGLVEILDGSSTVWREDILEFLDHVRLPCKFSTAVLRRWYVKQGDLSLTFQVPVFCMREGTIQAVLSTGDNEEFTFGPMSSGGTYIEALRMIGARDTDYVFRQLQNVSFQFIPGTKVDRHDRFDLVRVINLMSKFAWDKYVTESNSVIVPPPFDKGTVRSARDFLVKLFPDDVPQGPMTKAVLAIMGVGESPCRATDPAPALCEGFLASPTTVYAVGDEEVPEEDSEEEATPDEDPDVPKEEPTDDTEDPNPEQVPASDTPAPEPIKVPKRKLLFALKTEQTGSVSDYITTRIAVKMLKAVLESNKDLGQEDRTFIQEVLDWWIYRLTPESVTSIVQQYAKVVKVEKLETTT